MKTNNNETAAMDAANRAVQTGPGAKAAKGLSKFKVKGGMLKDSRGTAPKAGQMKVPAFYKVKSSGM